MNTRLQNPEDGEIGAGNVSDAPKGPIDTEPESSYPTALYAKFTPPASPRDADSASIASNKSSVSVRPRHPILLLAEAAQSPSSYDRGYRTPSPDSTRPAGLPKSIPPPHLPLRKSSSQLLRQRTLSPLSSPLNEKGFPRAEQSSPTYSTSSGRPRQPSATPSVGDESSRNGASSRNSGVSWRNSKEGHSWPLANRARGQTTSSHPSSHMQLHPALRTATSIPDYAPIRASNRTGPSTTYKPDRGPRGRDSDSYHSSFRRDPVTRNDDARASFRSGWTNTSSGFLDASGTERSSIVTKRSSISENGASISNQLEGDPEEGMSVEDAIEMYVGGFYDDPVVDEGVDISDEGYVSQAGLTPSPEAQELPPPIQRRHSAGMVERDSIGIAPPLRKNLLEADSPHIRTSTQIISSRMPSLQQDRESLTPVPRDRYGFKKATQNVTVDQYDTWNENYVEYLARRRKKWMALMKQYNLPTEKPTRFPPKSDKVKRYIRKGIPPDWRGAAWFWYAGGPGKLAQSPGLYWDLVEQVDKGGLSETDREIIERDLNRTFPDNIRFKPDPTPSADSTDSTDSDDTLVNAETSILCSLRRVLQAFAVYNPNIGYCQSLNFLAGLLLLFLDENEEKAFIMLSIITTIHLPGTHSKVLEANVDMGVLMSCIRESMPAVWAKIDDMHLLNSGPTHTMTASARLPTISLATTSWFMSLFVGNLPIESVLRVWDSFFYEGSKTLFRISLAIFKVGEQDIRAISDYMEILQVIQTVPRRLVDPNALMEACFRRRNGFGHLSQETIDARRAERRKLHVEDMARLNRAAMAKAGAKGAAAVMVEEGVGTGAEEETTGGGIRRAASKRFKRSMSRRRAKNG